MIEFDIEFYRKPNGDCPVADFFASLNHEMRFKMMRQIDNLEHYGNRLKGDSTKHLDDGIFEVRAQNKTDISRILFFYDKNRQIILTHGFIKKTQRLPSSELDAAKRYRAEYLSLAKEREAVKASEKKQAPVTIGPKWRPKLDAIVAEARSKSESNDKFTQPKKKFKER